MNLWNRRIKWMLLSIPLCPRGGRSVLVILLIGGMGAGYPILSIVMGDNLLMIVAMIGVFILHIITGAFMGRLLDIVFGSRSIIDVLRED